MNKLNISIIALALGFAFSAGAMAQSISKIDYKASQEKIEANYKSAKAGCESLSGNANDICVADAKGKEKVAMAELEAGYKPSPKAQYNVRIAIAEANYAVANERCDDQAGNAKDVCVKEAKAALISAKADAEVQLKTTDANATAKEKSTEARISANNKAMDARMNATADKVDAEYAVAKEKCDAFADDAKDRCQEQAKAQFGKK
jgi:hypothetical protein